MTVSTFSFIRNAAGCIAVALGALMGGNAWAAYSCSVTATSSSVSYNPAANTDSNGTVVLTCTRAGTDATTLSYRLKADTSSNYTTQRRAQLGATASYFTYFLSRGTVVGGAAVCGNSSTWFAPAAGTTNVITGTLNFMAALTQTATWGYCFRVRGTAGGNPAAPAVGTYTDLINVFAQYPNLDTGAITASAPITYNVNSSPVCAFNTFPAAMAFTYLSFGIAQSASQSFNLICSNALAWSLAVSPATAAVVGLGYSLAVSPASGSGTGAAQAINLTGTMPAGQPGSCATGSCSGTQAHTVTIIY